MRSIEAHFDGVDRAAVDTHSQALPSSLLNVYDGAVDSMKDLNYERDVKSANSKLKCARAALQSMLTLLTTRHSNLMDRVHEGVFNGLLHIQRAEVAKRAELMIDLNQNIDVLLNGKLIMTREGKPGLLKNMDEFDSGFNFEDTIEINLAAL